MAVTLWPAAGQTVLDHNGATIPVGGVSLTVLTDYYRVLVLLRSLLSYDPLNTASPAVTPVVGYGAGSLVGSVITFNALLGGSHKYTVSGVGAGPFSINIVNAVDAEVYNLVVINTDGRTLSLGARFLTFPSTAAAPSATAGSRTLISALYDATLDVFHTSLASR